MNVVQADIVHTLLTYLLGRGCRAQDVGVSAPYKAQVDVLRELVPDTTVEIMSFDAFQGRERDVMILSLVRSNADGVIGHVGDRRRANVALTRARRLLVVLGHKTTLMADPRVWRPWLADAEDGGFGLDWPFLQERLALAEESGFSDGLS